jgi:hypothetical protein
MILAQGYSQDVSYSGLRRRASPLFLVLVNLLPLAGVRT